MIAVLDALRDFPDVHVIAEGAPEVHGRWNGRRLLLVSWSGRNWRAESWASLLTGLAGYARAVPLRHPDRQWTVSDPQDAFGQADA
ncbi:hypothetical protein ABGB16_14130 [Micromonospora sp. B11E3]|uniref:hypothetical protein n=1 Tax=Micromonospora sp. B11E3 TaxID=3153562 RepID=UPI00325E5DCA